jgi:hypothetical protein
MLFYFSIDIDALPGISSTLLEERLTDVLQAHRRGHNLLVIDRPIAKWLLENLTFTNVDRATLIKISQENTQTGNLKDKAEHYINIVTAGNPIRSLGSGAIEVPIDSPYFSEIARRPVLVVEDIGDDRELVSFIFDNFDIRRFPVRHCFEPIHGGGDSICRVTEEKLSEHRIVISLYDSDMKSPLSACGKTRQMTKIAQALSWPLFYYFHTPCLEIENIVPLNVSELLDSVKRSSTHNLLLRLENLERADAKMDASHAFWLWFDLKYGHNPSKWQQITSPSDAAWIEQKLKKVGISAHNTAVAGLGPNLIRAVLSSQDCKIKFRREIRSSGWLGVFENLFLSMLWVCAAPQPSRT